jgi:hypothetical protein
MITEERKVKQRNGNQPREKEIATIEAGGKNNKTVRNKKKYTL